MSPIKLLDFLLKLFMGFVIYNYKYKTREEMKKHILDQIADMRPGDSIDITFPEGFTVDYTSTKLVDGKFQEVVKTSPLKRMNVWYWDEDDHCCKDYYFYNGTNGSWFAKARHITKESWEKINAYLRAFDC